MADRVRAPVVVVDPAEILELPQMLDEFWNLKTLFMESCNPHEAIVWLARRQLLRNSVECTGCNQPCRLMGYAQELDGRRWKCNDCKFTKSIRDGSFFSRSHLYLQQIMLLVYCWAYDLQQGQAAHEAQVNKTSTIVDWYNFCREECEVYQERQNIEIGGFDVNGQPIEVEIDESKYFHRKYHRRNGGKGTGSLEVLSEEVEGAFLLKFPTNVLLHWKP